MTHVLTVAAEVLWLAASASAAGIILAALFVAPTGPGRHTTARHPRLRTRTLRPACPDGPAPVPAAAGGTATAELSEPYWRDDREACTDPDCTPGDPPCACHEPDSDDSAMPDSAFVRPDWTGLTQVHAPWADAERPATPPERDTTRFHKIVIDGKVARDYAKPLMHDDPNMLVSSWEGAVRAR